MLGVCRWRIERQKTNWRAEELSLILATSPSFLGWPEQAPYDAIIVTCAAAPIPPPLIQQLKPGGRLVIPEGQPMREQWLVLVEKDASGKISRRSVLPVAFVPLTRELKR